MMSVGWKSILIIVVGLSLNAAVQVRIDRTETGRLDTFEDELYFRSGETLKRLSFGFSGLLSDIYWIRTVRYFGKKLEKQKSAGGLIDFREIPTLEQLLYVTTDLDPHHLAAYRFGAFFLAYQDPESAVRFTERGIKHNTQEWRLHQDLGFIYWRGGRFREAGEAYAVGARLNGAPAWMQSLAATLIARGGDSETAREMLERLYQASDDENIKRICLEQLAALRVSGPIDSR